MLLINTFNIIVKRVFLGKPFLFVEKLFLESDIRHYRFVSQAEVIIDGVDDKKEMAITDVFFAFKFLWKNS